MSLLSISKKKRKTIQLLKIAEADSHLMNYELNKWSRVTKPKIFFRKMLLILSNNVKFPYIRIIKLLHLK